MTTLSKSEHKVFVNFLKQLLLIKPNNAKDKLSKNAPLGKFINSSNYKRSFFKEILKFSKIA